MREGRGKEGEESMSADQLSIIERKRERRDSDLLLRMYSDYRTDEVWANGPYEYCRIYVEDL